MIVYRTAEREASTAVELERLAGLVATGDAAAFLVGLGELEQGVVDALRPAADGWGPVEAALRRAALGAGAAYLAARRSEPPHPHLRSAWAELEPLSGVALPHRIRIRPPEGYVHYALDPAGYAEAAAAYRAEAGARQATRAVVVGARSIGTSLSAVVAAAVGSERTVTVRPRGVTGERRIAGDATLEARLAPWLREGADALVVDEGPGATGETLAALAAWLRTIGVEERRIVLFPSSSWGMPLAPLERQAWFAGARKFAPPLGDARPGRIAGRLGLSTPQDLSAGRWREAVPGAAGEVACVGHERCKYRASDGGGAACLLRYAGLGRWGEAARERAARLASAGAGPEPVAFEDGFLVLRWLEGGPVRRDAAGDPAFLAALAGYLSARAPLFRTGHPAESGPIAEMLVENATEALGAGAAGLAAAVRRLERLPPREAVVADGRVQHREWLRTAVGYRKVDALDHGDGLRLPGPADAAWDLAGAAIEFTLDNEVAARLVERVAAAAGDDAAGLADAVAAYRAPYAAYHLGDAVLSAREATTPEDRSRLELEAALYRRSLARELRRAGQGTALRRAG